MTDPFGGDPFADSEALDGDDPFDSASSAFVQPEDLDGRLILIMPKRLESKKGKNGDPYDAIFGDVVVLSGQPADKIDAVPTVLEDVMWSSGFVVSQLRPKLARKRPVLGVLNSRPSTYNRQVRAYGLGEPDDAQRVIGRKGWKLYQDWLNKAETDPFA